MTASDINHLVAALRDHSAAISNQVETLAPDEPDRVGADFRVSGGKVCKYDVPKNQKEKKKRRVDASTESLHDPPKHH